MNHRPTSATIKVLTPLWERLLQRPAIGIDDNFFDLGGNPSSAAELFAEIAQVCARELPLEMIYHAPTIAALGALLEQPGALRCPPLVLLKAGTEPPPIFMAHGMGGSVTEFFQLVRQIRTQHPIYGMQARGTDGVDEPFERIEDMAQFYLDAIKKLQPHGPYLLVGYSLGGLVTLEMAQRLSEKREKVALLAMVDAYPHGRYLSAGQRVRLLARRARQHASILLHLPMGEAFSYLAHPAARRLHSSRDASMRALPRPQSGPSIAAAKQRVSDSAYLALTRYRPRFYPGKIKFVKAAISSEFPDDLHAVWVNLANELEIETVPGDHHGILRIHFESLATVLSRHVKEAVSEA